MDTTNKKNQDLPAFACSSTDYQQGGLTKREYFVAMAMQAMISNSNIKKPNRGDGNMENQLNSFAKTAVEYADVVLLQLESVQS